MGAAWGFALFGITRNLAPVRVNLVSPGYTDTEIWGNDEQRVQRREMFAKMALLGQGWRRRGSR